MGLKKRYGEDVRQRLSMSLFRYANRNRIPMRALAEKLGLKPANLSQYLSPNGTSVNTDFVLAVAVLTQTEPAAFSGDLAVFGFQKDCAAVCKGSQERAR